MEKLDFKLFLEKKSEFEKDVENTLKTIPKKHAKLVKDYDFKAHGDNVLSGDPNNVGEIDEKKKHIKVSSPWNYSRCFVALHEIAHAVYKYIMTKELIKEWNLLVDKIKKTKNELEKDNEEVFCMMYAQVYCKNKMEKYNHPELENFIKKLPK